MLDKLAWDDNWHYSSISQGTCREQRQARVQTVEIQAESFSKVQTKDDDKPLAGTSMVLESEKSSESQTVFNMVNAILGAGVLGLPFCYRSCGLVLTTVLVLLTLAADEVSLRLLVACRHIAGRQTYEDLAGHVLGSWGQHLVEACVMALNLGNLVAFINILADCCSSVSGTIIPPGAEPSRNVLLIGATVIGALPVTLLVRSPRLMGICSQAVVGFVLLFGVLLTFLALNTLTTTDGLNYWQWEGVGVSFPVIAYSSAHHVFFSIYSSMRGASVTKINTVVQKSMAICYTLYLLVGASGYTMFRERTSGDLMRNLGGLSVTGLRGVWERALKMGYGLCVMGTIPLVMEPFYSATPLVTGVGALQSVSASRFGWAAPCDEQWVAVTVLGCGLCAAILIPNVEFVFGLMGSTFSMLLAYILPSVMFLSLTRSKRRSSGVDVELPAGTSSVISWNRLIAICLLLFGGSASMVCSTAMLRAVHREAEVVQQATQLAEQQAEAFKAIHSANAAQTVAAAVDLIEEATKQLDTVQKEASVAAGVAMEAQVSLVDNEDGASMNGFNHSEWLLVAQQHVNSTLSALEGVSHALANTAQRLQDSSIEMAQMALPSGVVEEKDKVQGGTQPTISRVQEVADELSKVLVQPHIEENQASTAQEVEKAVSTLNKVAEVASETLTSVENTATALEAAAVANEEANLNESNGATEFKDDGGLMKTFIDQMVNATVEATSQLDESLGLMKSLKDGQESQLAQYATERDERQA